jgi:hypothetical protein
MNEFIQQCRNAIGASYVLTDKEDICLRAGMASTSAWECLSGVTASVNTGSRQSDHYVNLSVYLLFLRR